MNSIDRIIFDILTWWRKRHLYRACPRLHALTMAEKKAKASHKPTRKIDIERRKLMADLLKGGV